MQVKVRQAVGHVAKFCKTLGKEKEASGNLIKGDDRTKFPSSQCTGSKSSYKQVSMKPVIVTQLELSSSRVSEDPVSLLYSSDSKGSVDMVRVSDQGSRPQYVNIKSNVYLHHCTHLLVYQIYI